MIGHALHGAPLPATVAVVIIGLAAAAGYLFGIRRAAERGRRWPVRRTVSWCAGVASAVAAVLLAGRGGFVAHMVGHVLLGMLAPLLLVLAAPVTVALRALPAHQARLITGVLGSGPARFLTAPVTAALINSGGLWLIYRTDVYSWTAQQPLAGLVVHVHVLLAGCLFVVSMVGPDPAPHRARLETRAVVLVLAIAVHNILAKVLYAQPPAGVPAEEAMAGAQVMYYGGAVVEIAMLVLLGREWLARERRTRRRTAAAEGPGPPWLAPPAGGGASDVEKAPAGDTAAQNQIAADDEVPAPAGGAG